MILFRNSVFDDLKRKYRLNFIHVELESINNSYNYYNINAMSACTNCITDLDLLAPPIAFTYKGKESKQTCFGGFCSLLGEICFWSVFLVRMYILVLYPTWGVETKVLGLSKDYFEDVIATENYGAFPIVKIE
jgi:hypothetical protein